MPNAFPDMSRSDLAIMAWQWMDDAFCALQANDKFSEEYWVARGRCIELTRVLHQVTGIPEKSIKRLAQERYNNA